MAGQRRQTTQAVAWFWDLHNRDLLDLDPPYQRRSVWSQSYKDYFIDTLLLNYPAPAIFLFEDIDERGAAHYSVVDGKQRLSTIFEFLENVFPVSDTASRATLRGLYFGDFPPDAKRELYQYQFSIEYLPTTEEGALNNIFDRINRNVARLTPQELRHARFSGDFAARVETLTDYLDENTPNFPRIAAASRRQMKDAEMVAQLLLLVERGIESYTQEELDAAYSERDEDWEEGPTVEQEARSVFQILSRWAEILQGNSNTRRLRNQADYYSLFAAVLELERQGDLPSDGEAINRLSDAMEKVASETLRQTYADAKAYYEAARSASNDAAQRRTRVNFLVDVLRGITESARA